jgi:hypothetical protein
LDSISKIDISNLTLDSIFTGKMVSEIHNTKLHFCISSLIENPNKKDSQEYGLCLISDSVENCSKGKIKIILEKSVTRTTGKANFQIIDELNLIHNCPKVCFVFSYEKLPNEKNFKNYIIQYQDVKFEKYYAKVQKVWEIDINKQRFKEIEVPKNHKFQNVEFDNSID